MFYLKPIENPIGAYWFAAQPIGYHKLNSTVARICTAAGVNQTATAASCLYQAGVNEQIIVERTGHKSIDSVCRTLRTHKHSAERVCF